MIIPDCFPPQEKKKSCNNLWEVPPQFTTVLSFYLLGGGLVAAHYSTFSMVWTPLSTKFWKCNIKGGLQRNLKVALKRYKRGQNRQQKDFQAKTQLHLVATVFFTMGVKSFRNFRMKILTPFSFNRQVICEWMFTASHLVDGLGPVLGRPVSWGVL